MHLHTAHSQIHRRGRHRWTSANGRTNENTVFNFAKCCVQLRTNRQISVFVNLNFGWYFYHFIRLFRSTQFLERIFHRNRMCFTKLNSNAFSERWLSPIFNGKQIDIQHIQCIGTGIFCMLHKKARKFEKQGKRGLFCPQKASRCAQTAPKRAEKRF